MRFVLNDGGPQEVRFFAIGDPVQTKVQRLLNELRRSLLPLSDTTLPIMAAVLHTQPPPVQPVKTLPSMKLPPNYGDAQRFAASRTAMPRLSTLPIAVHHRGTPLPVVAA